MGVRKIGSVSMNHPTVCGVYIFLLMREGVNTCVKNNKASSMCFDDASSSHRAHRARDIFVWSPVKYLYGNVPNTALTAGETLILI